MEMMYIRCRIQQGVSYRSKERGIYHAAGLRRTLDAEAVGPAKLGRRSKRSRPAQSDSLGKGQEAAEDEGEDLEAGHWS